MAHHHVISQIPPHAHLSTYTHIIAITITYAHTYIHTHLTTHTHSPYPPPLSLHTQHKQGRDAGWWAAGGRRQSGGGWDEETRAADHLGAWCAALLFLCFYLFVVMTVTVWVGGLSGFMGGVWGRVSVSCVFVYQSHLTYPCITTPHLTALNESKPSRTNPSHNTHTTHDRAGEGGGSRDHPHGPGPRSTTPLHALRLFPIG
jgi:hypothetical protein